MVLLLVSDDEPALHIARFEPFDSLRNLVEADAGGDGRQFSGTHQLVNAANIVGSASVRATQITLIDDKRL